jgi:hypothetical protein
MAITSGSALAQSNADPPRLGLALCTSPEDAESRKECRVFRLVRFDFTDGFRCIQLEALSQA